MARNGIDEVGVRREGMLYLTNTLSGVGEVHQTAFYGLPSDVAVVGVWREGMLYLTNTLSGVGEVYQTASYGLPSDVAVVGVRRELSADQLPPPVVCTVASCNVSVPPGTLGFLAPIANNPPDLRPNGTLKQISGSVLIDKISIDPLEGAQWQHVFQEDTWIRVDALSNDTCVVSLPNVSVDYALPNIAWDSYTPTTLFQAWPVVVAELCESTNMRKALWGLNKSLNPLKFDYPEKIHSGVDFFVTNAASSIPIRSIADGIVVGIGVRRGFLSNPNNDLAINQYTHRAWGAANVYAGESPVGYAVIVRYGHFFVLYGHLKTIEVLVGKYVQMGDVLGILGSSEAESEADRHLHIKIHTYGQSISPDYSEVIFYPSGILRYGRSASDSVAPYHYDLAQFLSDPPNLDSVIPVTDIVATANLSGPPENKQALIAFTEPLCNLTYYTQLINIARLQEINGYRGFSAYKQSGKPLVDPHLIVQP